MKTFVICRFSIMSIKHVHHQLEAAGFKDYDLRAVPTMAGGDIEVEFKNDGDALMFELLGAGEFLYQEFRKNWSGIYN
jgi:hypothetical protein